MNQKWCLYSKPKNKWRYVLIFGGIAAFVVAFCLIFCKVRPFAVCSNWRECKLVGFDWKAEGNYEFLSFMDSIGVLDSMDLYQLIGDKNFADKYFFSKDGNVFCWQPLSGVVKTSVSWDEKIHKSPIYFYKDADDDAALLRHRNVHGFIVVDKIENMSEDFVETLSALACPEFDPIVEGISEERWGADAEFYKNLKKRRKEDAEGVRR